MRDGDAVATILAEWREQSDDGVHVDPEDVIRAHPHLREELREGFAAFEMAALAFGSCVLPDAVVPESIGDYRVLALLGLGGMGRVYLAEAACETAGLAAGERVALKVLHPHLLQRQSFLERFLREAETGRSVRHDNVVRTIAADTARIGTETAHFLVMEYVEGRTLRDLLHELGRVPEALLREIGAQLAAGLAAIHAAGIVHRDIKPENALITDDHRLRVMDLGVARSIGDGVSLTQEGAFVGSLAYAAPEQMRASGIDARADLHSLGVLLYELATGDSPFRRDDVGATIDALLTFTPPAVSDRAVDVSEFLSEVIATLMRKDRSERFASAEKLAAVLAEGESCDWWTRRVQERPARRGRVPSVPVSRETRLHGRDDDLSTLREVWESARSGEGRAILVEGEAGIGKSRLIDAFLRESCEAEAHVLYGSNAPGGGTAGLHDAVVGCLGSARLASALRRYVQHARALLPAFAALLTGEGPPEEAAPLRSGAVPALFCQLLRGMAAERPVLWVVEDLHFASAEDREAAYAMARVIADHPVLLVLTTRPGVVDSEIAELGRLRHFRRLRLGRLSPRDVISLLRDAFRSDLLADKLGAQIAYKSDGVPFFVFEMIRALEEQQFITQQPDGSWVETRVVERLEVPSGVRDLIEARLRDLGNPERALLDVGAVQGYEFDPGLVAEVLERRRIHVLQDLAGIERRSGIVRSGRGVCRFDHHQIQEVLYESLTPDLRSAYHAALAECLERRAQADEAVTGHVDGATAVQLARHALEGAQHERARRYLGPALAHLTASHQRSEAVALALRALEVAGLVRGELRFALLSETQHGLMVLGRLEESERLVEEALEIAEELADTDRRKEALCRRAENLIAAARPRDALAVLDGIAGAPTGAVPTTTQARALGVRGRALLTLGRTEEALSLFQAQLDATSRTDGPSWGRHPLIDVGRALNRLGRCEEALEAYDTALDLASAVDTDETMVLALGNGGATLVELGRFGDAQLRLERAIDAAREAGMRSAEADAIGKLGNIHRNFGRHRDARECTLWHLEIAREVGHVSAVAISLGNLALDSQNVGLYRDALELMTEQLEVSRANGIVRSESIALVNLGATYRELGDHERSRSHLHECLELVRAAGIARVEGYALHELAELAAYRGDVTEAEQWLEKTLRLRKRLGADSDVANSLFARALLWIDAGRVDDAVEPLREGGAIALECGLDTDATLFRFYEAVCVRRDVDDARRLFRTLQGQLNVATTLDGLLRLWRAVRQIDDLRRGHEILSTLRENVPPEYRDTLIENVPVHREIAEAWAAHGDEG